MIYLFSAYTVAWLIIFSYLFLLFRRENKIREQLHFIEHCLQEKKNRKMVR
ncbi:CcmD family protein [Anoxybacillus tengchongensis]|uniref:CcmD family protein n=1 Tax=Anoxybacillus tengchongensis TaxID=576944 RepID=A0A7W9YNR9_9BACL|nr:CcmD family protein [Anoxybacillus tengchongensis]MBB6175409.1 CcmD family protein [Anoxybacillus tengchongensis]